MKKKILFIISNMESGGVSKSMSSLLNTIDTKLYDIDCFISSPQGIFMDSIPQEIHVISDKRTQLFLSKFPQNIKELIKKGFVWDAFVRIVAALFMTFNKGIGGWILSRRMPKLNKTYDLAVDYNGQHQLYYLIDTIKAKKKVSFFHNDYEKWSYYYFMDKNYIPKLDQLFSVSNQCVKSLKKYFPLFSSRISVFENISSINTIRKMSGLSVTDNLKGNHLKLITLGHVCERKGSSLAINAARLLKDKGIDFTWYFLGLNEEEAFYLQLVKSLDLNNNIVFMGLRSNPYPYIKQADILVHPSTFEGKSIALDEAKLLCKPIVVTNFSTVTDQFIDRVNASICAMTPNDVAAKIEELIQDEALKNKYIDYLQKNITDNTSEVEKLYTLIETQN